MVQSDRILALLHMTAFWQLFEDDARNEHVVPTYFRKTVQYGQALYQAPYVDVEKVAFLDNLRLATRASILDLLVSNPTLAVDASCFAQKHGHDWGRYVMAFWLTPGYVQKALGLEDALVAELQLISDEELLDYSNSLTRHATRQWGLGRIQSWTPEGAEDLLATLFQPAPTRAVGPKILKDALSPTITVEALHDKMVQMIKRINRNGN